MHRPLHVIDHWLWIERGIWLHENRALPGGPDAQAAMRRIDTLLEERTAHTAGGTTHGKTGQAHT